MCALFAGMDNAIKLWDIKSKELIHSYACNDTINALRFTPDGKWVAAASRDGNITIWDLAAGNVLGHHRYYSRTSVHMS